MCFSFWLHSGFLCLRGVGSALQLWFTDSECIGLVALRHMGSSQSRDQAGVGCIGRQIRNHWITIEVLKYFLKDPE